MELQQLQLEKKKTFDIDKDRTNFTTINKKCAEVFIQSDENFYIECTLCFIQFMEFDLFTSHFVHEHSNKFDKNPLNFLKTEQDEYSLIEDASCLSSSCDFKSMEVNVDNKKFSTNQSSTFLLKTKQNNKSNTKKNITEIFDSIKEELNQYISCDICGKIFLDQMELQEHEENDHLFINPLVNLTNSNNQTFSQDCTDESENENENVRQSDEINVKECRYCFKVFRSRISRIHHERVKHTGHKPFKCEKCDKCFATDYSRRKHQRLHIDKQFKCNLCDILFVSQSYLNRHIKRHNGQKLLSCNYCEKKFFSNTEKNTHERTHTGEKPFQCISCGQCFTTSSHLLTHTRRYHETEFEKPHKCEICNKSFVVKGSLNKHIVIHSDLRPFECEICKKTFKLLRGLKIHKQIHSDERKYGCDICGKRFKQDAVLRCHMKSHGQVLRKECLTAK